MNKEHDTVSYQDVALDNSRRVRKFTAALLDRMRWLAEGVAEHRFPDDRRAQEWKALRWALCAAIGETETKRLLEQFSIELAFEQEDAA